jgi:ATP-dependent DNA ligase
MPLYGPSSGAIPVFSYGQVRLDWPASPGIYAAMLRMRPRLSGFIEPCLPSSAPNPPAGDGWIHEIKLDGFRMLARRDGAGVRLLTRRGIDWTTRYPAIAAAIAALACRSCLIDGEVVICGEDGIPVFDRLRYGRQPQSEAVLLPTSHAVRGAQGSTCQAGPQSLLGRAIE